MSDSWLFTCPSCSSQESAKAKNQKEVIKTLKELKLHVPADKQHNSKSTTLSALKYALRCVKQVEGLLQITASLLSLCFPIVFISNFYFPLWVFIVLFSSNSLYINE